MIEMVLIASNCTSCFQSTFQFTLWGCWSGWLSTLWSSSFLIILWGSLWGSLHSLHSLNGQNLFCLGVIIVIVVLLDNFDRDGLCFGGNCLLLSELSSSLVVVSCLNNLWLVVSTFFRQGGTFLGIFCSVKRATVTEKDWNESKLIERAIKSEKILTTVENLWWHFANMIMCRKVDEAQRKKNVFQLQ